MRSFISTETGSLLNVTKSAGGRRWLRRVEADDPVPGAIQDATGCHPIVAKVLAGRDIEPANASAILAPSLRLLMPDPSLLRDAEAAAGLLADLAEARAKVGLFGDYDVDGAASCALLARWLTAMGAEPLIHIPDRITEGYGPNIAAIDAMMGQGIDALVTLDCGATSHEALSHAKGEGISVVVLDHHQMSDLGPAVDALVNPNRPDDTSGLGHLCAAGVTFMTLVGANRALRARGHAKEVLPDLLQLLDLVGLATVADVVPLRGLNRAFVVQGLKVARARSTLGLAALIETARLTGPLQAHHFGYILGPRINAGGRIGDAAMGARLLTTTDQGEAAHLAGELDTLNAQRQAIETEAVADAIERVERAGEVPPVLVLRDDSWHQGVIGLIAARLKERFHRPSLAFTLSADGHWTGSARSIAGIDIGAVVAALVGEGVLAKGGGHAMAAGMTVETARWERFCEAVVSAVGTHMTAELASPPLVIDAVLTAEGASLELINALEVAAPYGSDFPEPLFVLPSHRVVSSKIVGTGHVKARLIDGSGKGLDAIAFRAADTELGETLLKTTVPVHVAGSLSRNSWQGRESAQMRIVDVAKPLM
ncbi:MAG: single-stranded-DNA-specific exonuclease RecJ [Pseudomonadota bacterium]